jgi:hypothetical protein
MKEKVYVRNVPKEKETAKRMTFVYKKREGGGPFESTILAYHDL